MTLATLMTTFSGKDRDGKRHDISRRLQKGINDPAKGQWVQRLLDDRHTPRPVHDGPRFAFQVISREQTPYHAPTRPYLHIQVTNPDSEHSECVKNDLLVARLTLKFDDITHDLRGYQTIQNSHATEIWKFLRKHGNTAELILVNCDAGLCRSSGIVAALADAIHGEGFSKPIFDTYIPNPLVYDTVLAAKPTDLDFAPIVTEAMVE